MPKNSRRICGLGAMAFASLLIAGDAASAQNAPACATMRKINIGVSVSPPNVVHTSP